MSFYISFKDMVNSFGVDLKVTPYVSPAKKPHFHYVGGEKVEDGETSTVQPETRHEPVVPFNSQTSFMAQFLPGGEMEQADLLWISTKLYPKNTIVEVPSQPGQKYRVVDSGNWQGYSDVVIYVLKGDAKHPYGR